MPLLVDNIATCIVPGRSGITVSESVHTIQHLTGWGGIPVRYRTMWLLSPPPQIEGVSISCTYQVDQLLA